MIKLASMPLVLIFVATALYQNIGMFTLSMLFSVYLTITRPFLQTITNFIAIICEYTQLLVFAFTFGITLVDPNISH